MLVQSKRHFGRLSDISYLPTGAGRTEPVDHLAVVRPACEVGWHKLAYFIHERSHIADAVPIRGHPCASFLQTTTTNHPTRGLGKANNLQSTLAVSIFTASLQSREIPRRVVGSYELFYCS